MQLALDLGNTRAKYGLFTEKQLVKQGHIPPQEGESFLNEILSVYGVTHYILSRTGGGYQEIEAALASRSLVGFELSHHLRMPFINHYATPSTLGADRMALVAAAVEEFPGQNCLVLDAGTCLTLDLVNADGHYLGGSIHPGIHMRLEAMHQMTERLPRVEVPEEDVEWPLSGSSTRDCILIGGIVGLAAEIDGMLERYREQYPEVQVVFTGGDAPRLVGLLKSPTFARPEFQIQGLNSILLFNSPNLH